MRVSTVAIRTVSCWPTPRWSSTLWNDVQSEKIHFKLYSLGECADRISTNYFGRNCPSVNRVRTSFVEIQFLCKLFRKNRIKKKIKFKFNQSAWIEPTETTGGQWELPCPPNPLKLGTKANKSNQVDVGFSGKRMLLVVWISITRSTEKYQTVDKCMRGLGGTKIIVEGHRSSF